MLIHDEIRRSTKKSLAGFGKWSGIERPFSFPSFG